MYDLRVGKSYLKVVRSLLSMIQIHRASLEVGREHGQQRSVDKY